MEVVGRITSKTTINFWELRKEQCCRLDRREGFQIWLVESNNRMKTEGVIHLAKSF